MQYDESVKSAKRKSFFRAISLISRNFGAYKPQILILTALGFLSGILEGIGANALIPLFSFVVGGAGETEDFISRMIRETFAQFRVDFNLKYLLILIALLFICKAIILFVGNYIQARISSDYEKRTRSELFYMVVRSQWRFLLHQKIGYLEKVVSTEVQMIAKLFITLSGIILILTGLLMYVLVAINISFVTTVITIAAGIFLLAFSRPFVLKIKQLRMETATAYRQVAHFINENVIGAKTIKIFAAEKHIGMIGNRYFEGLRKLQIRSLLTASVFGTFTQPFSVIFILFVFSFSYKTTDFNLPSFAAIIYLIQRIFTYIQQLQAHMQTVYGFVPYLENLSRYQRNLGEYAEKNNFGKSFIFAESLEFEEVSFSYSKDVVALNHINIRIGSRECVGIIGHSGSGKTTVVDLILRLFEPDSGRITLDGIPLSEINIEETRKNIGYVSQEVFMLNDTMANNIRFYDQSITNEKIVRAAKEAHIYDFINGLPQKFDTFLG